MRVSASPISTASADGLGIFVVSEFLGAGTLFVTRACLDRAVGSITVADEIEAMEVEREGPFLIADRPCEIFRQVERVITGGVTHRPSIDG